MFLNLLVTCDREADLHEHSAAYTSVAEPVEQSRASDSVYTFMSTHTVSDISDGEEYANSSAAEPMQQSRASDSVRTFMSTRTATDISDGEEVLHLFIKARFQC